MENEQACYLGLVAEGREILLQQAQGLFLIDDPGIRPGNFLEEASLRAGQDQVVLVNLFHEILDTVDQGKFIIYRETPLAIKNGAYIGYKTPHHMYYKSPWSANCVVFTGPNWDGMQPKIDFDGTPSWAEWKAERDKTIKRPPTGVLQATEANDKFTRALGDLSGSCPPGTKWTRELVFLGYKYLIVLDRVKAGKDIQHRWTLHTTNKPAIDGTLATADNGPGRLFCKTLLPAAAKLTLVGGEGHEYDYNGENRMPLGKDGKPEMPKRGPKSQLGEWRLDVTPADGAAETLYVHVLFPTDIKTEKMPACSAKQDGGNMVVTVGEPIQAGLLRVNEWPVEGDAHYSALGCQRLHHLVSQAPGMAAEGVATAVRVTDGTLGDFDHLPEGRVVDMGQVHRHAQASHRHQ